LYRCSTFSYPEAARTGCQPGTEDRFAATAAATRSSRSLAFRARIVLECASGESNAAVAAKLRTTGSAVGMWRNRFITGGWWLGDEMRPERHGRSAMTVSSGPYA